MDGAQISEILIRRGKRVCTSKDISELFPDKYLSVISNLTNTRWITPIKGLRGIYYVSEPDEKVRSYFKTDSFQILVMVLKTMFGTEWYFGKMSAISLLGLIHQPVSVYYVINKLYSKSIDSNIFGKVVFVKSSADISSPCGVITKKYQDIDYRVCTTERNMADYLYLYVHGHTDKKQINNLFNYPIEKQKTKKIISKCYPKKSSKKMITLLEDYL